MQRTPTLLFWTGLTAAVLAPAVQASDTACLAAGSGVKALAGTLHSVSVFGGKRYGAKPAKDAIDQIDVLILDQATCLASEGAANAQVRALQVVFDAKTQPTAKTLHGRHVVLDGALRPAADARDRTDFVLEATSAATAAGGNTLERLLPAPLLSRGRVPVRVGMHGPKTSACTGLGRISGSSQGQLRERGSDQAGLVTMIAPGDALHLCEQSADGEWFGVIVKPAKKAKSDFCKVVEAADKPTAYRGRCASGWLRNDEIVIEAS